MGRQQEGFAEMRIAHELDPTSELTNVIGIYALYLAHQYDQAIDQARKTIELYPGSESAYYWLAATYERKGMYQQAMDAYLKSKALSGSKTAELAPFRSAYQKSGMRGYWQLELEIAKRNKPVDARQMANVYGHVGDKERTLEFLNQGFQQHCGGLSFLNVDPLYDGLREDPKFKELIKRLRL
jgi:tetratricopeptide (TPR) repeat protein